MRQLPRLVIPLLAPLLAGLALGGCKDKSQTEPTAATPPSVAQPAAGQPAAAQAAAAAQPAGARRIDVNVGKFAYKPDRITGKPGEPLVLVFHWSTDAGECGHELLLPDNRKVVLNDGKPTEVALTMPTDKKELGFTCGMNMLKGTLIVE